MRSGNRFKYLWFGILAHGLVVEMAAYWVPDIDNFWHAQTPIMFLGRRLPLYIIILCKYLGKYNQKLKKFRRFCQLLSV